MDLEETCRVYFINGNERGFIYSNAFRVHLKRLHRTGSTFLRAWHLGAGPLLNNFLMAQ